MESKNIDKNDEKFIINKLASNIDIIYKTLDNSIFNVNYDLYVYIKSKFINMDSLLPFLEEHNEEGIIDYLINLMTSKFLDQSFFYISQLIILISYKKYCWSLEQYILDRCTNQIKFSIKITLLLKAFKSSPNFQKLLYNIENSLIKKNISIKDSHNSIIYKFIQGDDFFITNPTILNSEIYYYYKCLTFYENLNTLCLLLFKYPLNPENNNVGRKDALKEFIHLINQELNCFRKENYVKIQKDPQNKKYLYNKGYLLPFNRTLSNLDPYSFIIVNIIPEHSFCFNTKERVPIKLCCECIEISECENFFEIYDDPDFYNDIDNNSITRSTNEYLNQQSSFFESKTGKIFDKWKDLEKFNQIKKNEDDNLNDKEINYTFLEKQINDFIIIDFNLDILNPFGEPIEKVNEKIKEKSKFKNFKTYKIKNFIAKANDDLKQEMFALQMIKKFQEILSKIGIFINSYEVITTSPSSGLIEFLPNTNSIDGILKSIPSTWKLNQFFRNFFKNNLKEAQKNFAESLAGFCIISYFLQIKDRHNGNIMLDNKGHIFHIDFGFIFGSSPKNLGFEKAEFKLVKDYVDILDGFDSELFIYFKKKFVEGIIECKKHHIILSSMIRIMFHAGIKCFDGQNIDYVLKDFQQRFLFNSTEEGIINYVDKMIKNYYENFFTKKYDYFQYLTNGILY